MYPATLFFTFFLLNEKKYLSHSWLDTTHTFSSRHGLRGSRALLPLDHMSLGNKDTTHIFIHIIAFRPEFCLSPRPFLIPKGTSGGCPFQIYFICTVRPFLIQKGTSGGCPFQIHFIFPCKHPFLLPKRTSDGCPFQIRSGCGCQLDFRTQNGRPSDILCYMG